MLEEGLARELLQRRQLPFVAVEAVGLVALVDQEAEPGRGRLEHRCIYFWMPVKKPDINTTVTQSAASDWKFCTFVRKECGNPAVATVRRSGDPRPARAREKERPHQVLGRSPTDLHRKLSRRSRKHLPSCSICGG